MTSTKFAEAVLAEAARRRILTARGNIRCAHGKSISRNQLVAIYERCGRECPKARTSKKLDLTWQGICRIGERHGKSRNRAEG